MTDDGCDLTERELYAAQVVGQHYAKIMRRVVIAMTAVAVIVIVGGVAGWLAVRQESVNRTNAIQSSRVELTVRGCLDTNNRHDDTIAVFEGLVPSHPTPAQRQGAAASRIIVERAFPYRGNPRLKGRARSIDGRAACERYARERLR